MKNTFFFMLALASLAAQAEAVVSKGGGCNRCPIDIRQGPGFWNLVDTDPYTGDDIFDDL